MQMDYIKLQGIEDQAIRARQIIRQFDFDDVATPDKLPNPNSNQENDARFVGSELVYSDETQKNQVESSNKKLVLVETSDFKRLGRNISDSNSYSPQNENTYLVNPGIEDSFGGFNHPNSYQRNGMRLNHPSIEFKNKREDSNPFFLESPVPRYIGTTEVDSCEKSPMVPNPRPLLPPLGSRQRKNFNSAKIKQDASSRENNLVLPTLPGEKSQLYKWIMDKEKERELMQQKLQQMDSMLKKAKLIAGKETPEVKPAIKMVEKDHQLEYNNRRLYEKPWKNSKNSKQKTEIDGHKKIPQNFIEKFINPTIKEEAQATPILKDQNIEVEVPLNIASEEIMFQGDHSSKQLNQRNNQTFEHSEELIPVQGGSQN